MAIKVPRSAVAVLVSSSVVIVTYRLLQWRARKRARKTVDRINDMVQEGGPLVSCNSIRFVS
jgi:hypothetical protein